MGGVSLELVADCERCTGLCCVVPAFSRSADFAIDKPARTPCPNLADDFRCSIHAVLPERGFRGCTVYDCFGAGQQVTRVTAGARDRAFEIFETVRSLHELLWYLTEASRRGSDDGTALLTEVSRLAAADAATLEDLDVGPWFARADAVLTAVSAHARRPAGKHRRHADLTGKDLRRTRLVAADLRGAYLIGSDLRGVDLTRADLLGADLRGADLRGADLEDALFVTRAQVAAARTDGTTRLRGSVRP